MTILHDYRKANLDHCDRTILGGDDSARGYPSYILDRATILTSGWGAKVYDRCTMRDERDSMIPDATEEVAHNRSARNLNAQDVVKTSAGHGSMSGRDHEMMAWYQCYTCACRREIDDASFGADAFFLRENDQCSMFVCWRALSI